MRYATPRIVPAGSRRYLWWLLLLALLLLLVWWRFGSGLDLDLGGRLRAERDSLQRELSARQARIEELERERGELIGRVAMLERSSQIDRAAARQAGEALRRFQERQAQAEEELTLLRSMLSGKGGRGKLEVQSFRLEAGARPDTYLYRFTVSQAQKSDQEVEGWIFLGVDGTEQQKPRWLPLREISEGKAGKVKMRFKHFQEVKGEFRLPEGFTPRKVIVEVKPNNKKLPPVKQLFDWVVAG